MLYSPFWLGALAVLTLAFPAFSQSPTAISPDTTRAFTTLGERIGSNGLVASTAPGLEEIFADAYREIWSDNPIDLYYWFALEYDESSASYLQTYASPIYSAPIRKLAVADFVPTPGDEIMVLLETGDVYLYEQLSKREIGRTNIGISGIKAVQHRDMIGDSSHELALLADNGFSIYSIANGLISNNPAMDGDDLVVGQMDADPGLEVAFTTGKVLDLATGNVQTDWALGFGFELEAIDFDNDGRDELIVADSADNVWAFAVDFGVVTWTLAVDRIDTIQVGDTDGDGSAEVVVGESNDSEVTSYDLMSQAQVWSMTSMEHGCTSILIHDCDGDGVSEVTWAIGQNSTGPDFLTVWDPHAGNMEWTSIDLTEPFIGPAIGDVDGDGVEEIIVLCFNGEDEIHPDAGRIIMLEQGQSPAVISTPTDPWTMFHHNFCLYDMDGNGDLEVIVAGEYYHDGTIQVWDYQPGGDFIKIWENNFHPSGSPFYSVQVCDIDGDGSLEILAGGSRDTTGSAGTFVYAFSYATGDELWHTTLHMGGQASRAVELIYGDFDGDLELEIAARLHDREAYIYSADGTHEATIQGQFHSMRHGTIDAANRQGLVFGKEKGVIWGYRFDGTDYVRELAVSVGNDPVEGFQLLNPIGLLTSIAGTIKLLAAPNYNAIWQSEPYGPKFGSHVLELGNGKFATVGHLGLYFFQAN